MAKALVDRPELVAVEEMQGPQTTVLKLMVDKNDVGRITMHVT